jgi:hypothetical protein
MIQKANLAKKSEYALISLQNWSDFDSAIPWFESRRPSQPVPSLWGVSDAQKSWRHFRDLAEACEVSRAEFSEVHAANKDVRAPVSGGDFSIFRFCYLRRSSKALRPPWNSPNVDATQNPMAVRSDAGP